MANRKARCKVDTETLKLTAAIACVTELVAAHHDEGRIPDTAHLDRKVSALRGNWDSFEIGYQLLYGIVTDEQEIVAVKGIYERQMPIYNEALEKGESLHASLHVVGPAPLTTKERFDDCLMKRSNLLVTVSWLGETHPSQEPRCRAASAARRFH